MRTKLWVITVTPQAGYGVSYNYIYHNGENAMDKFLELVKEHNLDVVGLLGDKAIAATAGNHNHIDEVKIYPTYTMD